MRRLQNSHPASLLYEQGYLINPISVNLLQGWHIKNTPLKACTNFMQFEPIGGNNSLTSTFCAARYQPVIAPARQLISALPRQSVEAGFLGDKLMPWGRPLSIELLGLDRCFFIDNTAAAADYLLENWPYEARGAEYWPALESCLADLEGEPSKARECFIAAAKAAALNILPATVH